MTSNYKRRKAVNVRVDCDSFVFKILEESPEEVILQWGADEDSPLRCDIGILCYLDRLASKRYGYVNPLSLCDIRKKSIKKILSAATSVSYDTVRHIRQFINFIDTEINVSCDISNISDLKHCYISYTSHLQHLLQLSRIDKLNKGIGSKSASRKQHGAMQTILILLENISEEAIRPWASTISRKDTDNSLPIIRSNNDHYARMFAIHLRIFQQISDFVLNEKKIPLILNMHCLNLTYDKFHIWSSRSSSESTYEKSHWMHWGLQDDRILEWSDIKTLAHSQGVSLGNNQRINHRDFKRFIINADFKPKKSWTNALINIVINSFCYALIADSGCNWSALRYIDFENITFIKELDKTRLISIKPRAEYKIQHIEINARFIPFFRKYLKIRKLMGVKERYGVFIFNDKYQLKLLPAKGNTLSIKRQIEYLLKSKVPWVGARDWRWNVSYEYLNASKGDIRMVSRVLGNTQTTVRKHYAFSDFETSAIELTTFYRELAEFSRRRVRTSKKPIPVKLNVESTKTLSGRCGGKNIEDAILVKGFTKEATQPDCGIPSTCFMCENYALHADEHDFKKILSIKYWLEAQGRRVASNDDEFLGKYQPIIERIEEILAQAILHYPEAIKTIADVTQQVDAGQYDSYWQIQIDALIDGGFL